eukprot:11174548-Lingulodinium_polyedra.AAC.1
MARACPAGAAARALSAPNVSSTAAWCASPTRARQLAARGHKSMLRPTMARTGTSCSHPPEQTPCAGAGGAE